MAYLNSEEYGDRFGHRSGRWLIVTTTERRMRNMLSQAKQAETKGLFYFTTFDNLKSQDYPTCPDLAAGRTVTRLVPLLFID